MKELIRCKACGFVMESDKLRDVCPACGMSYKVFEPYRERVALNRLTFLGLDLHPITIHLSQSFVILIPLIIVFTMLYPDVKHEILINVLRFAIYAFPLSLMAAFLTGITDGLFRFKTINTPFLRLKIILSSSIFITGSVMLIVAKEGNNGLVSLLLSLCCLFLAIRLGLLGKKLLNVILPGSYPVKKPKIKGAVNN